MIFLFYSLLISSQNIKSILNSKSEIRIKLTQLEAVSLRFTGTNLDSAKYVARLMDSLAETTTDYKLQSDYKWNYAVMLVFSKPDQALQKAYDNLQISNKSGDCKLIAKANLLLAKLNWYIPNQGKVFEYYDKAIAIAEKCNDKETLLLVYSYSGMFYFNTQQYNKNKEFLFKMEKIDSTLRKDAGHNSDIGDIFRAMNALDSADFYYMKAIKLIEEKKDSLGMMGLYYNYSLIPRAKGNFKLAIEYCKKGLLIAKKLNDLKAIINGNKQLFDTYSEIGDLVNAKKHLLIVINKNEERNCLDCLIGEYRRLSEICFAGKSYEDSYTYLLKSVSLFESKNNSGTNANLAKVEEGNLKKQKQLEINLINQQKEAEKRIKNISFIALGISFILIIGIIFSLVKIKKSKKLLQIQQVETEKQKHLVEEKQKEIIDSITYAKRLQDAILPRQEFVNSHLKNNFIYYQPKDIVAGDFYWAEKFEDLFFIAAADSTGHGVPGAMVSVVCSNALNRTLKEFKLSTTGEILDKTRELVIETFEKSSSDVKDGMDISLLCIDYKNKNIFWSGANNPLWYIQDGELKEIKADKQPIGKTDNPKSFTTHQIQYKENSTFYLFTDGLADQFGGPNGKKFKYKQFSDLLLKNSSLSQEQQYDLIGKAFLDWKGTLEQVDDVCVIGIKI